MTKTALLPSAQNNNVLPPTGKKVHLGFFCIMSTSISGNGTVILLLTREIWLKYFPRFEK